jgi:hypothetical protein
MEYFVKLFGMKQPLSGFLLVKDILGLVLKSGFLDALMERVRRSVHELLVRNRKQVVPRIA